MAKFIAQIIVLGTQVLGRAFARAVKQEIEASQEAARRLGNTTRAKDVADNARMGITIQEAKQILNVNSIDKAEIEKRYKFLFDANEKAKGGSFYIQSKIVRARERLEHELTKEDNSDTEADHVK